MSMLLRYKRKKEGFMELLLLLESCGPKKRDTLLETIQKEDASWAEMLRSKVLTFERIMSWDAPVIAEITSEISPKILAFALKGTTEEVIKKATSTFPHMKVKELKDMIDGHATPAEVDTARSKIIAKVREIAKEGKIDFSRFDSAFDFRDVG